VTVDEADFYTGLVARLYSPLRSADPDPAPYAGFIAACGEPALELGCGDGDPMLALWVLHWYSQDGFRALDEAAGLEVAAVLAEDGRPAAPDADVFVFWLTRPS